jgi:hypothetical protein
MNFIISSSRSDSYSAFTYKLMIRFIITECCGQAPSAPLYIREVPGSNPGTRCGFFSEFSPHHHIVVYLISQIRRMLGLSTYHLPSAPILAVPIPNLPVNVAEKALEALPREKVSQETRPQVLPPLSRRPAVAHSIYFRFG